MGSYVTNRIHVVGNDFVEALRIDILKAFNKENSTGMDCSDIFSIKRVFTSSLMNKFSLKFNENNIGAKWAHQDGPFEYSEDLRIISEPNPIFKIQDFLLHCVSELDATAVVQMEYDEAAPDYIGYRLILKSNGKIIEFFEQLDTESIRVVSDDELEEAVAENAESEECKEVITWEDLWHRLAGLKTAVIKNAITRGPSSHVETLKRLL